MNLLGKIFLVCQLIFSVASIVFGALYGIRCLLAGQLFCAVCFAIIAYVCGYLLLFRNSVRELREFYTKKIQTRP